MIQFTIAIVGHTNTGKTSLVRALTNERNFGDVNDAPSTTIDVTTLALASTEITLNFIDTPGIEDAIGILEILETRYPITSKKEEVQRLHSFIQNHDMYALFEQEIKVIKQLLACDIAFYVIDTRLPFLPKFDYEIQLILQAHKPVLPILNFLTEGQYLGDWKTHLKAHGLHQLIEYDTIILPRKKRLYEQIAIMFPDYYNALQNFIQETETKELARESQAYEIVSNFFINLLTLQIKCKVPCSEEKSMRLMEKNVLKIEKRAIDALLTLYHFNEEDIKLLALSLTQARFDPSFLTTDNLINFSVQFGKGAATGAGLFAGLDALTAFTTLGTATAAGAIIGGLTNTLKHYGGQLWDKWQEIEIFCVSDQALLSLTARILLLVDLLNGRSHADINPILLENVSPDQQSLTTLIDKMRYLRAYPEYCDILYSFRNTKARDKVRLNIKNTLSGINSAEKKH